MSHFGRDFNQIEDGLPSLPASNVSWLACHAYKLQRWVKFLIIIKYYTLSSEKTIDR